MCFNLRHSSKVSAPIEVKEFGNFMSLNEVQWLKTLFSITSTEGGILTDFNSLNS